MDLSPKQRLHVLDQLSERRVVHLYKDEDDNGFVVEVPSLPGCISQGETREEALDNIRDAAEGWLETHVIHGDSVNRGEGETLSMNLLAVGDGQPGDSVNRGGGETLSMNLLAVGDGQPGVHGGRDNVERLAISTIGTLKNKDFPQNKRLYAFCSWAAWHSRPMLWAFAARVVGATPTSSVHDIVLESMPEWIENADKDGSQGIFDLIDCCERLFETARVERCFSLWCFSLYSAQPPKEDAVVRNRTIGGLHRQAFDEQISTALELLEGYVSSLGRAE